MVQPVDVLQGASLNKLLEGLRRYGVIPPASGRDGGLPFVLIAPSLEPIDESLIEASARGFGGASGANTVYHPSRLIDVRLATRIVFLCRSSFNQAVTVQVRAMESNTTGGLYVDVGAGETLDASNGRLALSVNLDDMPMPFLGATFETGATAPTAGSISIRAYGLRWKYPAEV